jgi:oligoribonuclease
MARDDRLIWIDLEMTGLVPETDRIIEIATVVTDADLAVIAEGPVIAVRQPEAVLVAMDEWNTRTHGASGLSARVRARAFSILRVVTTRDSSR